MTITTWTPERTADDAAQELAAYLADGHPLPDLETDLLLDEGEILHVETRADVSWYGAMDIPYERLNVTGFGGLGFFLLTTATTAIGNRWRRSTAQRLATPQWRPLGHSLIYLTSERVLIDLPEDWMTIWHDTLLRIAPQPEAQYLQLTLTNGATFALQGPAALYLSVALGHLVGAETF